MAGFKLFQETKRGSGAGAFWQVTGRSSRPRVRRSRREPMRGELPQTSRPPQGLRHCRLTLLQVEFLALRWLSLLGAMLEIERFTQGFFLLAENVRQITRTGKIPWNLHPAR